MESRVTQEAPVREGDVRLRVSAWAPYWRNELGARGVRPSTVVTRLNAVRRLTKFYDGFPDEITSTLLVEWRESMRSETVDWRGRPCAGLKVSTVNGYLASIATFLRWLTSEGVLTETPRFRLLSERNEPAPPMVDAEDLRKLANGAGSTTQGRSQYEATRYAAILAHLLDTGLRASECAGLLVEHVDVAARQAYVHADVAKGGYPRMVTFGFQTARLLNRYLLARRKHRFAFMEQLFLGRQGPASYPLVRRVVKAAGKRGGVAEARPHMLRHSWAHNMKDAGVGMETLMALGGWRSMDMPLKYGRAGREERAMLEYQRMGSPVDRARASRERGA
jgi:integrase